MEFLFMLWLGTPMWLWLAFFTLVATLLALDLGVLNRNQHVIGVGESLRLSAGYIILGLLFGGFVWWQMGAASGLAYLTGFVIEKSLAMDNVFVIAMIFSYFAIPREYQHRVLFWGIVGVIVLRGVMIALGSALVTQFEWVLYIFAAILIFTGIRMGMSVGEHYDVAGSPVLKWIKRRFRVTDELHGDRFFVRRADPATGKMRVWLTPLMLALVMVEAVDVIFAVDSVPAIFAITTDPYLVYTSNIFAILGLRALYFALSAMVERFHYLKYALAVLLVFIGSKIFVADALGLAKIPPALSLGITFAILVAGVAISLWKTRDTALTPRQS